MEILLTILKFVGGSTILALIFYVVRGIFWFGGFLERFKRTESLAHTSIEDVQNIKERLAKMENGLEYTIKDKSTTLRT